MPKVFLSPSMQDYNISAINTTEKEHANQYIDKMIPFLDANGIEWRRNYGNVQTAIAESNAWNPDIHYCAHTNAYDTKTRNSLLLVYWANPASKAYRCAVDIKKYRETIYPYPIRIEQNRTFAEIIRTKAPCVYDEILFHDNYEDISFFIANMESFARTTVQGMCDYFGITFKEPSTPAMSTPAMSTPAMSVNTASGAAEADSMYLREVAAHNATKQQLNAAVQAINRLGNKMVQADKAYADAIEIFKSMNQ